MDFTKNVVVPAARDAILGRIFSFLLDNFPWPPLPGARDVHRRRLERLLGIIGTMVEEAEGRHITNHQLLARLKALTDGMYRARYALEATDLDDSMNSISDDDDADDDTVTTTGKRSLALRSPFMAVKRARLTSVICGSRATERLATTVDELEGLTRDYTREFIMLVQGYPQKVYRPVTTTLYMDRCVFGRHVEKERIVNFLLQRGATCRKPYLNVLAVIGAKGVGKTRLVRHAQGDERLRDHFVRTEWFDQMDVLRAGGCPDERIRESDGTEYLAGVRRILDEPQFAAAGPSLLVFDDAWYVEESAWAALASSPTSALAEGSKLIFMSRNAHLGRIGTVEPVVLARLREEEYWYYFKAFAFRGADPRDHPRIAAVGREISNHLERTFPDAQILGKLLRDNFNARFWRRLLASIVECVTPRLRVGVLLQYELLPVDDDRLQSYGGYCWNPPKLTAQDVLSASPSRSGHGGGDSEDESSTIHLSKETPYMYEWYRITLKKDGRAPPNVSIKRTPT